MAAPKVAILQNQFHLSGRTKVMCEIIWLLNEMNIEPDVLTFTPVSLGQSVGRYFGLGALRFNLRRVAPIPFSRGTTTQVYLINQLTKWMHDHYDLVVNSNDTLYSLSPTASYLHYIHFPIAVGEANLDLISPAQRASWIRRLNAKVVARLLKHSSRARPTDMIYTNSSFSEKAILTTYPESSGHVKIIYPPAFDGEVIAEAKRERRCISLGTIIPDKNQLQQLEIARQIPDIEFWIVGSIRSQTYYQTLVRYIKDHALTNVKLETDMPFSQLQDLLATAMFFLHTKQEEHFGISTAQAIAAGCIPVTHDSGGQRDVVPLRTLRFNTTAEAVAIFQELLTRSPSELNEIRLTLQQHVDLFSRDRFREHMREALLYALSGDQAVPA
jgi:glycosyltransferase involved in cell wall biosynthesis